MARRVAPVTLLTAGLLLLTSVGAAAQQVQASFPWSLRLSGLPQPEREWGYVYVVYDTRETLRVEWTFRNQSTTALQLPAGFLSRVRFTLKRGGSTVDLPVEWEKAEHISELVRDTVPAGLTLTLGPGDSYGGTAILNASLADGEQFIFMSVAAAVEALTWSDGTEWRGQYLPEKGVLVRVKKAETFAERRSYHYMESREALRRGQSANAVLHATAILQESPNDVTGHYVLGTTLFALRRYREAIRELELVRAANPSGIIVDQLAYGYLAIGDEQKAEAMLRGVRSPDDVRSSLERMRARLRQEGIVR